MMGNILVTNHVPDMELPRHHYFDYAYLFPGGNYDSHEGKSRFVQGAVDKVKYVLANLPQAKEQLEEMRKLIVNETYASRVQTVLDYCGFGS